MAYKFKSITLILAGFICLVLLFSLYTNNNQLKRDINALEAQKKPLLNKIKADSIRLIELDRIILDLKISEAVLNSDLKKLKHEKSNSKGAYINSNINDRVKLFAKLAAGD